MGTIKNATGKLLSYLHADLRPKEPKKTVQSGGTPAAYTPYGSRYPFGDDGSGGEKYRNALSASGSVTDIDHYRTRNNARTAYSESTTGRAMVNRFVDTVVGSGLRLEAMPIVALLGMTQEDGEKWATDVENRWELFIGEKKQHRAEQFNFMQAQRAYMLYQERDNDIFTRLFYNSDPNLISPLQFDFVDPFQLRQDAWTPSDGFIASNNGIARDERGREVEYCVSIMNPAKVGEYNDIKIPRKGKSGRYHMIHSFIPEYAGQERGFSRLHYAIQELEKELDLSSAQIQKAINQSGFMGWVEPSQDAPASNPLESVLTGDGVRAANDQFSGDVCGESPLAATENVCPVHCYELPEATFDKPGSTFIANLQEGEKLRAFPDTAAMQDYGRFMDAFVSSLTAGNEMPYEVLKMKFANNYSASRATLLLFWEVVKIKRSIMKADFLDIIYEMWLSEEIAAGRIMAPGFSDPRLKKAWLNTQWIGSPVPNIDPEKTARAEQLYLEMGAQTPDQVSANYNGTSGASNRAKNIKQADELILWPWQKHYPLEHEENSNA